LGALPSFGTANILNQSTTNLGSTNRTASRTGSNHTRKDSTRIPKFLFITPIKYTELYNVIVQGQGIPILKKFTTASSFTSKVSIPNIKSIKQEISRDLKRYGHRTLKVNLQTKSFDIMKIKNSFGR